MNSRGAGLPERSSTPVAPSFIALPVGCSTLFRFGRGPWAFQGLLRNAPYESVEQS